MEITKLYVVNWCTSHEGHVEYGGVPCLTTDAADKKLKELWEQSHVNMKNCNCTCMGEFNDGENYYLESVGTEDFEAAYIEEKDIYTGESVPEEQDTTKGKREIRIRFSSEVYIKGDTMEQMRDKWESMDLFRENPDGNSADFIEIDAVEDGDTCEDLRHQFDHCYDY